MRKYTNEEMKEIYINNVKRKIKIGTIGNIITFEAFKKAWNTELELVIIDEVAKK